MGYHQKSVLDDDADVLEITAPALIGGSGSGVGKVYLLKLSCRHLTRSLLKSSPVRVRTSRRGLALLFTAVLYIRLLGNPTGADIGKPVVDKLRRGREGFCACDIAHLERCSFQER